MHGDDAQGENENRWKNVDEEDLNRADDLIGLREEQQATVDTRGDDGQSERSDKGNEKHAEDDDPGLLPIETRADEKGFRHGEVPFDGNHQNQPRIDRRTDQIDVDMERAEKPGTGDHETNEHFMIQPLHRHWTSENENVRQGKHGHEHRHGIATHSFPKKDQHGQRMGRNT